MKRRNLIDDMERMIVAHNAPLKDKVKEMDVIELLSNVHPSFRSDYVYLCRDAGLLHPSEVNKFIPKPSQVTRKFA